MNYMLVCKLISRTGYTFYREAHPPTGGAVFLSFFLFFCCVHCSGVTAKYFFLFFVYIPVAVDFCGSIMFVLSQIEKKHCDIIMS